MLCDQSSAIHSCLMLFLSFQYYLVDQNTCKHLAFPDHFPGVSSKWFPLSWVPFKVLWHKNMFLNYKFWGEVQLLDHLEFWCGPTYVITTKSYCYMKPTEQSALSMTCSQVLMFRCHTIQRASFLKRGLSASESEELVDRVEASGSRQSRHFNFGS